jgi:hypothetical protein
MTMQQYPRAHVLSSLAVVLDVTGPATIILTAHEIVRIDRVAQAADGGVVAERHGDLLKPGMNTIHLDPGTCHFRTRGAARLHVIDADHLTVGTVGQVHPAAPAHAAGARHRRGLRHQGRRHAGPRPGADRELRRCRLTRRAWPSASAPATAVTPWSGRPG